MSRRRGVGLVGSVCTRAQQRRGAVGSREVYVPKPHARVRHRVLLPGAPICCRMQQAVGCQAPSEVFLSVICSQHSSVSLSSRSLSSIEQAQSPSPIYFQNVVSWKRRDTCVGLALALH